MKIKEPRRLSNEEQVNIFVAFIETSLNVELDPSAVRRLMESLPLNNGRAGTIATSQTDETDGGNCEIVLPQFIQEKAELLSILKEKFSFSTKEELVAKVREEGSIRFYTVVDLLEKLLTSPLNADISALTLNDTVATASVDTNAPELMGMGSIVDDMAAA